MVGECKMSENKYFIKKVEEEFNINNTRNKIIRNLENKSKIHYFNYKYSYAFVVLLLFVSVLGLFIYKDNDIDYSLKINELSLLSTNDIFNKVTIDNTMKLKFDDKEVLRNLEMPKNLVLTNRYNVYYENELYNNVSEYSNDNMMVQISYSTNKKIIKEYVLNTDVAFSYINNEKVKIYNYKNMYLVDFEHDNIYYYVMTKNINENELTILLRSIIKK